MTEKELKRLSRAELLELLLMQTRESELLQMKLEAAKQELDARELNLRKAGNLANAVLVINGVLESTQNAAQQYLDNIELMERQTRLQCIRMMDEMEQVLVEAQQTLADARRDPVPLPPILCQRLEVQAEDEPKPENEAQPIPAEIPAEQDHPVDGRLEALKEFWNTASRKALALMKRYGLLTESSGEG